MDPALARRQQIEARRAEIAAAFPGLWSRVVADWKSASSVDAAWLLYSANYLFRTAGVRWAMDPLILKQRVPAAPEVNPKPDLDGLAFVVLTHAHKDHLDLDLLRQLGSLAIRWIVPAAVWSILQPLGILPENRAILAEPLVPLELDGIRLTPFDGLHWENALASIKGENVVRHGIDATGYLVEFGGKRWLFPGDTRRYDAGLLPRFGPVDGLFAHLWLGRGCALLDNPPLLDDFCRFFTELSPRRVIVTHLEEFGRDERDFWDDRHYRLVAQQFEKADGGIQITSARIGNRVQL